VNIGIRLFFMRHGLADRRAFRGKNDDLRPLTEVGKRRIEQEADTIARLKLGLDVILTSPLTRARQTAEIVALRLGLSDLCFAEEDLGLGFDVDALVALLAAYPEAERLLLVGHEPGFSEVMAAISGGSAIVCKKGSLARVDLTVGREPEGELVWLIPPRVLAR
jgi:phosphohistidine phosphatase